MKYNIRQDGEGNIVGGARVLGPIDGGRGGTQDPNGQTVVPVLPKVQRNSASRLPFLMEILPRLMNITKETTPMEIRECLLREYGAEVHLQQCRRAKTEILKKREGGDGGAASTKPVPPSNTQNQTENRQSSMDGMGSGDSATEASQQMFGDLNGSSHVNQNGAPDFKDSPGQPSPHPFTLHTAQGVVMPVVQNKSSAALSAVGEQPVKCPYCINHRWMKSISDAVEHMSMHVVV
ncbi:hypothetical protein BGZ60DRAFT_468118 [Tricladium varicosporioides]|nr:hypothetical protein BGZ60DRAFT_468118 [Hymenoscyphus varicosporioides]